MIEEKAGVILDRPDAHLTFWEQLRDFFTETFVTSSEHMVSNLRIILLLIGGLFLLLTLWRVLKKLIDFIRSLWVESEPN